MGGVLLASPGLSEGFEGAPAPSHRVEPGVLVGTFNGQPMTVHEEESGEGWPAGGCRLWVESQASPDEGAIKVQAVGAEPREREHVTS